MSYMFSSWPAPVTYIHTDTFQLYYSTLLQYSITVLYYSTLLQYSITVLLLSSYYSCLLLWDYLLLIRRLFMFIQVYYHVYYWCLFMFIIMFIIDVYWCLLSCLLFMLIHVYYHVYYSYLFMFIIIVLFMFIHVYYHRIIHVYSLRFTHSRVPLLSKTFFYFCPYYQANALFISFYYFPSSSYFLLHSTYPTMSWVWGFSVSQRGGCHRDRNISYKLGYINWEFEWSSGQSRPSMPDFTFRESRGQSSTRYQSTVSNHIQTLRTGTWQIIGSTGDRAIYKRFNPSLATTRLKGVRQQPQIESLLRTKLTRFGRTAVSHYFT